MIALASESGATGGNNTCGEQIQADLEAASAVAHPTVGAGALITALNTSNMSLAANASTTEMVVGGALTAGNASSAVAIDWRVIEAAELVCWVGGPPCEEQASLTLPGLNTRHSPFVAPTN